MLSTIVQCSIGLNSTVQSDLCINCTNIITNYSLYAYTQIPLSRVGNIEQQQCKSRKYNNLNQLSK